MKTCIYLDDPTVAAAIKEERYNETEEGIGVLFDKVDTKLGLKHDDLSRAMYIAKACGKDGDLENVRTLLSTAEEAMLKEEYIEGEIPVEYLNRWLPVDTIKKLTSAREAYAKQHAE